MKLIKTSILNGFAVLIKMLTMLGLNKILAVYVGPSGYAALGQFQNAIQIITTFGSGAINTGVTKYTAEYKDNQCDQHKLWRTSGTIALISSIITSAVVAIFHKKLSVWFLKDENYSSVFIYFSISLIFFVFNSLILAILNGKKEIERYVAINIAGSLFSLLVSAFMIVQFGLYGAIMALAINQSLVFFITLIFCYKLVWCKFKFFFGRVDKKIAINLSKYTVMALTSALTVPVSHMLIREHLGNTLGWSAAGYWEAMWRLSAAYLMFVTTTLSVYYLPRLSELKDVKEIKKEILSGYKIILPVAAGCGLAIYFLRDFITQVLFSKEFMPMRNLFFWQILGDTVKIASWLLGYVLAARAFVKIFILSEILFSLLFFGFVYIFVNIFGIEGAVFSHFLNYLIHFIFMFFLLKAKKIL